MRRALLILFFLGLPAVLPVAGTGATVVTKESTVPVVIPSAGAATPYPSPIAVSGAVGPVQDVNATIRNFSHGCSADADILLAGPGGQSTILFSDAGADCGPPFAANATFTLDDEAPALYPCGSNPSGTFKPTNNPESSAGCGASPDPFTPPAPGSPYPVSLGVFDGSQPDGTWNLFVFDDSNPDMGTISGGWSLTIDTPPQTTITKRPPNKSGLGRVKYKFTSDEPGSSFECKLASKRKATFRPCASPFKAKVADGKHKFLVRAKDQLGGLDATPVKDKFKILD